MAEKKLPISLTMIVKNEEKFLAACLQSVKDFVSEIIIVDTGSEDTTKEIAASFGAQIFDYEWDDDFSAARNYALEQATQPWILQLDADEEIFKGDEQWFYKTYPWKYEGYWMYIYNYKADRSTMDAHPLVRFFKNKPKNRFKYKIHENLMLHGKAAISGARIFHKGYATEEDDIRKLNRNLGGLKKRLKEHPDEPLSHYYFSQIYAGQKDFKKAAAPARKALKLGLPMPAKGMALRIGFIAAIQERKPHKFKEILDYCPDYKEFPDRLLYEAQFVAPTDGNLAMQLLNLYMEMVKEAIRDGKYGKVEYIAPDNYPIALRIRSDMYSGLRRYQEALDDLEESLKYMDGSFNVIVKKASMLMKLGRVEDAISTAEKAIIELDKMPNEPSGLREKYHVVMEKLRDFKEQEV